MKFQLVTVSLLAAFTSFGLFHPSALAQGVGTADEDVRSVINTASYSAVFGAAMGAALLPFIPDPGLSSLRYIAGGASIGFFVGSGVALYRLSHAEGNTGSMDQGPSDVEYYEEESYSDSGADTKSEVSLLKFKLRQAKMDLTKTVPQGALFVGNKSEFKVTIPAIAIGQNFGAVQLLDYRF